MRLSPYPQCCKANVLHDFGYGHLSETSSKHVRPTKEQVLSYLNSVMPQLSNSGIQVLFACPTNHQPEAIEALTEFGFFGAPDEELLEVAHLEKGAKYTEDGKVIIDEEASKKYGYNIFEYEDAVHQMVPMFFLVPPPVDYRKYKGSDLHKADLAASASA